MTLVNAVQCIVLPHITASVFINDDESGLRHDYEPFGKLRTGADLIPQLLWTVLFHGLTLPLDREGFRVHTIVIVGAAGY